MYTLQILDAGQAFLHPLADGSLTVGAGAGCGVRLRDQAAPAGVLRFTCADGKLSVRADGGAMFAVGGRTLNAAELQLGDVVQFGPVQLLVGTARQRAVTADEVLDDSARAGRQRARQQQRRNHGLTWGLLAAAVVVVAVVLLALQSTSVPFPRDGIERARRTGDFAAARALLDKFAAESSPDDVARAAQIEVERSRVAAVETAVARLRQSVLDDRVSSSGEINLRLQDIEGQRDAGFDGEAARIVRGGLGDLLRERGLVARLPAPTVPTTAPGVPTTGPATAPPHQPDTAPPAVPVPQQPADASPGEVGQQTGLASGVLQKLIADADRLVAEEQFRQAHEVLRGGLVMALGADAQSLRARLDALGDQEAKAFAARAETARRAAGTPALTTQIAELAAADTRYTDAMQPALAALLGELRALPVARAAAPAGADPTSETVRRATLAALQSHMERINQAEANGDFAQMEVLLREGAALVRDRDQSYADRLQLRADDSALLAGMHKAVADWLATSHAKAECELLDGRRATLIGRDGCRLVVDGPDGTAKITWLELSSNGLDALLAGGKLPAPAWLGAAVLDYKNGNAAAAEALLARLLAQHADQKAAVDRVLARGRGEPPDPRGYTLRNGAFISQRRLEAQKNAEKLLTRIDGVLRGKDPKARDAMLAELMAGTPDEMEPVVLAFQQQLARLVQQFEKSPLKKQTDRLVELRTQLDRARTHAKELIYDEVKYFYPYRPPSVSPDKFAEYQRVQTEVDNRVAAVRVLWDDDKFKVRVPASLQADLGRLDFVARVLASLGAADPSALTAVEWARALPPGDVVSIKNFCLSPSERDELVEWQRIEAFNQRQVKSVNAGEREQLQVTNAYRAMFRHRPLALNLKLWRATRDHADEMSRLGYFSHHSPTEGRMTPMDRARLAGYTSGASENIALNDGAQNAHWAWCHSSGHHRNLLHPSHREFGIGAVGRYWVQNFGGGKEYAQDPDF